MLKKIIFSLQLIIISFSISYANDTDNEIVIGTKFTIHSDILDEDRKIWLQLPPNYTPDGNHPVLYILDGDRSFNYISGMLDQLYQNGKTPPMILVAILNTNRNRDLTPTNTSIAADGITVPFLKSTGGGDNFLQFLRTELKTYIEANYTPSKFRIFAGHSLGGLLTTYAFLTDPEYFNAFIAIDPSYWWDNGYINNLLIQKKTGKTGNKKYTLYVNGQ